MSEKALMAHAISWRRIDDSARSGSPVLLLFPVRNDVADFSIVQSMWIPEADYGNGAWAMPFGFGFGGLEPTHYLEIGFLHV